MKKRLSVLSLCLFSTAALAQFNNNNASQFAAQAGNIAGIVQSCGQDISVFNARVISVVNTLGKNASERQNAMVVYQQALSNAQYVQGRTHKFTCGEVISTFNSLPLMRPDFQQTVLPQMAQMGSSATPSMPAPVTTTDNAASATNQTPNSANITAPNGLPTQNNTLAPNPTATNPPGNTAATPLPPNTPPPMNLNPGYPSAPSAAPGNTQTMVTGNNG